MDMRSILGFALMTVVFVSACIAPAAPAAPAIPVAPAGVVSTNEVDDLLTSSSQIQDASTFDIGQLGQFDISIK